MIDPSSLYAWALAPARDLEDEPTLVEGLAKHLAAAGLSLARISTSFRPLDPQVWARAVTWRADRGHAAVATDRHRSFRDDPDYVGSTVEHIHSGGGPIRERLDPARPSKYALLNTLATTGATDYLILPILLGAAELRTFIAYTGNAAGGFTDEQIAFLHAIHPAVASLIRLRSTRLTIDSIARTYLGPNAARRVLDGDLERGHGARIEAAIWFCDLRGYTTLSETQPPQRVLEILNAYFETMANEVADQGGEVLKFIGDAMLAIFPVDQHGDAGACARAVAAAVRGLERFEVEVAARGRTEWQCDLGVGIGLHLGDAFYGNIGARDRLDFTVIGPAVNVAARVQGKCSTLRSPLLMTQAIARHLERDDVHALGACELKGVASATELFTLARYRPG